MLESTTVAHDGQTIDLVRVEAASGVVPNTSERLDSIRKPMEVAVERLDASSELAAQAQVIEVHASDIYITNGSHSGIAEAQPMVVEFEKRCAAARAAEAEDCRIAETSALSTADSDTVLLGENSSLRLAPSGDEDAFNTESEPYTNGSMPPTSIQIISLQPGDASQNGAVAAPASVSAPMQESSLLTVCGMSPLSPIRECAEGGSTPKVMEREAREVPDPHIVRDRDVCRSLNGGGAGGQSRSDNIQTGVQCEDVGKESMQMPGHPSSSGREKYEQLKKRFLEATRPADLKPTSHK